MQEIAMTILDIAQNSIRACAKLIQIVIRDSHKDNIIHIECLDDGCGMDDNVRSEFYRPA